MVNMFWKMPVVVDGLEGGGGRPGCGVQIKHWHILHSSWLVVWQWTRKLIQHEMVCFDAECALPREDDSEAMELNGTVLCLHIYLIITVSRLQINRRVSYKEKSQCM